jgi:hypothetical protein
MENKLGFCKQIPPREYAKTNILLQVQPNFIKPEDVTISTGFLSKEVMAQGDHKIKYLEKYVERYANVTITIGF